MWRHAASGCSLVKNGRSSSSSDCIIADPVLCKVRPLAHHQVAGLVPHGGPTMKRVVQMLVVALSFAAVAANAADSKTINGWVSDSMCGAKHAGSGAECVKKCISGGMKPVFVDSKKDVWSIDNPDAVKDFYGAHVNVRATENATNKSVHIDSIIAAK